MVADTPAGLDPIAALYAPAALPARCAAVARAVADGRSGWFTIDRSRLTDAAEMVLAAWGDARADAAGIDRRSGPSATAACVDRIVITTLLSAEPGPRWRWRERSAGARDALALPAERQRGDELLAMLAQAGGSAPPAPDSPPDRGHGAAAVLGGAEGLARASRHAFESGMYSADPADPDNPLRADALALKRLDAAALRAAFDSRAEAPLAGLEARATLLVRLGEVLEAEAARDGGPARPARLLGPDGRLPPAPALLHRILQAWGPIWPAGSRVLARPVGDAPVHLWAGSAIDADGGSDPRTDGIVPLHLMSRRLVVNLVAALHDGGAAELGPLLGLDGCSFFVDAGCIVARDVRDLVQPRPPGHAVVVEWRALAQALADELAPRVMARLGLPAPAVDRYGLALARAGARLAHERRDGAPAVNVELDGTTL